MVLEFEQAPDSELIRCAREGDEDAFEEIVRRYSPRIFHIAARFFRQRNLVEEVAQEVFLKAFVQLESFAGRGSFEGWLSRIATNTCLNEIRKASRRPESTVADLTDDDSDWLELQLANISTERHLAAERGRVAADLADRVLGGLSPEDRLVLMLIDGEELSIQEVSEMTGWSKPKVKVRAFRARRKMRIAVEKILENRRGKAALRRESKRYAQQSRNKPA